MDEARFAVAETFARIALVEVRRLFGALAGIAAGGTGVFGGAAGGAGQRAGVVGGADNGAVGAASLGDAAGAVGASVFRAEFFGTRTHGAMFLLFWL